MFLETSHIATSDSRKKYFQKANSVYQGFEQAKIGNGGLVLGSIQFPLLPQLPQ